MKKCMLAALAATGGIVAIAATNEVTSVAPVIVYASRIDESSADIPAPVMVLDREAVSRSGARDFGELLRKSANLEVRSAFGNPLQQQIAMRGFGEYSFGRVKVIVDGEELNNIDMDPPNLARIPLASVERVEVLAGASPVLHGDGASAGVINVTTDSRDYTSRTRIAAKGGSFGTFGANVATRGGSSTNGVIYSAAYDYLRSDGFRDHSGFDTHAVSAAIRQNFDNGSSVALKTHYFNALYAMPGALSYEQWQRDRRMAVYDNDWCRLWSYGLSLDAKLLLAEDQWLYLDGACTFRHRRTHWGDYGYANEYDSSAFRLSPRYVNEMALWDHDNRLTAGFDFRYDIYEVDDRSGYNNPYYRFDRARYAPFLHDEFFLTDELSLVLGARLEVIDNRWDNYRGLADDHSCDVLGDYELGLVYRPLDDFRTYVKGTRYHRSAFCDELNYTRDGRFLEPETGTSLDVGAEWTPAREWKFELSGYWTVIDDEIFYDPHAMEYGGGYWGGYNCNSPARTMRLGFDTGLVWRRDGFAEASLRYGFVDARFVDGSYDGNAVPLVPASRVRAELGWWLCSDLEVKGGFRYVSSQVLAGDFDNDHERLDGYWLLDAGAYYEPFWAEGWKASLVFDNLLDRNYCDFGGWSDYMGAYYYPAAGFGFMFTLAYEF